MDVRTLVAHLIAQCEDSIHLTTMLRRQLVGRFARLWPRAVRVRRQRPGLLRRITVDSGIPGQPRWPVAYLLDVIFNRDLWMHRIDLARGWSAAPVALGLTGRAGGSWLLGTGDPVAVVRADAVAYLRALSGRDDDVVLELLTGDATAVIPIRRARVAF
jgi:hypothetical protein